MVYPTMYNWQYSEHRLLQESLILLNLRRPTVCIIMQEDVMLITLLIVRTFLAEQWINAWLVRAVLF
jgi:hypothetical protein